MNLCRRTPDTSSLFGGGASILLNKQPCEVEVYNDVNRGLVNFFRVVADVDYFAKFLVKVSSMPCSRVLFEEYARSWIGITEPVEQAARWYYVARQSFSGEFGKSWRTSVNASRKCMALDVATWRSVLGALPKIHERISRAQIECLDWRPCLERYSGDGWLAYCDPPYVLGTRRAGGYAHELQDKDHRELIATLMQYDGAVMLSGYNSNLYAPLDEAGWTRTEVEVVCSATGYTRAHDLQGKGITKAKQRRTECVWRNPEAMRRIKTR